MRRAARRYVRDLGFALLRWSGHFSDYWPDAEEAEAALATADRRAGKDIPGVDLDMGAMLDLWATLAPHIAKMPFTDERTANLRYWYDNGFFRHGDAQIYFGILAHFRPRRIIEIGCGFTTALALDARDLLSLDTRITLIEPDVARVRSLLRPEDLSRTDLRQSKVQDIPPDFFAELDENDILFIDSSHILKTGSDVCYEFFEILPVLRRGVLVHVHDVGDQFEYPGTWVFSENRGYNEAYVLRAFLTHNAAFRTIFFNQYFSARFPEKFRMQTGGIEKNVGGSLWFRRVA